MKDPYTPTKEEKDFFFKNLSKDKSVLEYGCGMFSLEICDRSKNVLSVEHQPHWYYKVSAQKPNNSKMALIPPTLPFEEFKDDGTYEEFEDYVDYPISKGPFDIIFIDGRARLACASKCKLMSHKDTLVFVHDFSGNELNSRGDSEYKKMNDYLKLIDSCGTMAKFKIK